MLSRKSSTSEFASSSRFHEIATNSCRGGGSHECSKWLTRCLASSVRIALAASTPAVFHSNCVVARFIFPTGMSPPLSVHTLPLFQHISTSRSGEAANRASFTRCKTVLYRRSGNVFSTVAHSVLEWPGYLSCFSRISRQKVLRSSGVLNCSFVQYPRALGA